MKDTSPLVSVCVVTYNSAEFIIETLESIKSQTYKKMELIISDDCSSDNTVELCEEWIEKNESYFFRTEILTVNKKTGSRANVKRVEEKTKGKYNKVIAGDDYIDAKYIEKCVEVLINNPDCGMVFTNTYWVNNKTKILTKENASVYKTGDIFKELFMLDFWPSCASWMISKEIAEKYKVDEKIWPEDYYRILRIAENHPIIHIDEYLAYYRRHENNSGNGSIKLFKGHLDSIDKFKDYPLYTKRKEIILKYLSDCAEVERPFYLIRMAFEFCRFSYLKRYYSIFRRKNRASIKKTRLFKVMRQTWLWKKLKAEI